MSGTYIRWKGRTIATGWRATVIAFAVLTLVVSAGMAVVLSIHNVLSWMAA